MFLFVSYLSLLLFWYRATWTQTKKWQIKNSKPAKITLPPASSSGLKTTLRELPISQKQVNCAQFSQAVSRSRKIRQSVACSQRTYCLQLKTPWVKHPISSNWAVARNYEEMLDIHIKHFPQTSVEKLHEMANKGLQFFRMADSIDKGLQMLIRVAKYSNLYSERGCKKERRMKE